MITWLKKLNCLHKWEIKKEITIESEADMVKKLGYKCNSHISFKRQYVIIMTCTKCGKLHLKKYKTIT